VYSLTVAVANLKSSPVTAPADRGSSRSALLGRMPHHVLDNPEKESHMADSDRGQTGGITLGGIIVIAGIVVMILWSFWIGLIVALVGLIAFGGFARGKWY
jgi:hypothetical protein